jgi:small-conductance mechanosensitive channel
MHLLEQTLRNNTWTDWLLALGIVVLTLGVLIGIEKVVIKRLAAFARKTETRADDMLVDTLGATYLLLLLPLAAYFGSHALTLPEKAMRVLEHITVIGLLAQSAVWGNRFIGSWIRYSLRAKASQDPAGASTMSVIGFVTRVGLWTLALLLGLDNLGFNITALLAGLGVGGVAVALAAQNILGDLFASMSIALDKPFVIGDFIIVGDKMGNVEYIGLKTTRVRSLSGEQIVFSNNDLLQSRIHNYQRMQQRRVLFSFGVTYQATSEQLERTPTVVREIIESQPKTRFDRAHFKEYGDSALVFEVVYFVLSSDYNVYMDIQQAINLGLFRRLQEEGLQFAYPTRTIFIETSASDVSPVVPRN